MEPELLRKQKKDHEPASEFSQRRRDNNNWLSNKLMGPDDKEMSSAEKMKVALHGDYKEVKSIESLVMAFLKGKLHMDTLIRRLKPIITSRPQEFLTFFKTVRDFLSVKIIAHITQASSVEEISHWNKDIIEWCRELMHPTKNIFFYSLKKDALMKVEQGLAYQRTNAPTYLNQRNNKFFQKSVYGNKATQTDVKGDNMCNVTSLAMALLSLEDKVVIQTNLINLYKKFKGKEKKPEELLDMQLEDAILYLFKAIGADYWKKKLNPKGYYFNFYNNPPHQWGAILGDMGNMLLGSDHKYKLIEINSTDTKTWKNIYLKQVHPLTKKGIRFVVSTKLTGGHIVYLVSVKADGIVIHDPYGLNLGRRSYYIKNGYSMSGYTRNNFVHKWFEIKKFGKNRFKYHKQTYNKIMELGKDKKKPIHIYGKYNFFGWEEVKNRLIGKWLVSVK